MDVLLLSDVRLHRAHALAIRLYLVRSFKSVQIRSCAPALVFARHFRFTCSFLSRLLFHWQASCMDVDNTRRQTAQ